MGTDPGAVTGGEVAGAGPGRGRLEALMLFTRPGGPAEGTGADTGTNAAAGDGAMAAAGGGGRFGLVGASGRTPTCRPDDVR
jgi:hypothetical protein